MLQVRYIYDSWRIVISVSDTSGRSIGAKNPFRYRDYYYDEESGLYYLRSRYYDPEVGRFINVDNVIDGSGDSVQGYNVYAYCFNNPINQSDSAGNWPSWATKVLIGVAVIAVAAVATVLTAGVAGVGVGAAFAAGFSGSAIGVGASGLAVTIAGSAFAGAVVTGGVGLVGGALAGGISSGTWAGTLEGAANGFMAVTISGCVSGGIRGGINYAKTSPLIRSVSSVELKSIKSTGQFSSGGYSESKWFATNSTNVSTWANWFGQSDYVGVRVPRSAFKNFYFDAMLDNIGPAYNIEVEYLNSILRGIWYF